MENNENTNPFMQAAQDNQQEKKKSKTIAIAVIVIVLVLAIAAAAVAIVLVKNNKGGSSGKKSSSSAEDAAKTYAENMYDKNGFEKCIKITMLDDVYKVYKKDEAFEDDKDEHKDFIENLKDEKIKIKVESVKKGNELSDKEIKYALNYFKEQADAWDVDVDAVIDKGYEFKIKMSIDYDGKTETHTEKICVVNIKGEGWKVVNRSADDLTYLYDDDDDDDDDDYDFDDYDFDDFDFD